MEENSSQDSDHEEEVDEELEAMLYSQIHYDSQDKGDQEMITSGNSLNSIIESQPVFTVTPMKVDHSSVSFKDSVKSAKLASVKQQSLFFESIDFDNDYPTTVTGSDSRHDSGVVCVQNESTTQGETSCHNQPPDIIYVGSSSPDHGDSDHKHHLKTPTFDMEAELGIHVPLCNKKRNKTKHNQDTLVQAVKTSAPKLSETKAVAVTTEFIKIDEQSPQAEKDYRKTLNRLLTSQTSSKKVEGKKKVKDVVVIHSDSASTSNSWSESGSDSSSDSESMSSSASDSESDVEILGSAGPDQSDKEPVQDYNWNVSLSDRQTIERIEKRSSQVDESKWKISDADVIPVKNPKTSRYYSKKDIRCRNCDKEGHLSKNCPVPKKKPNCGLCGMEGHLMNRCTNRLCFNCSQPGHRGFECPLPKRRCFARCSRCQRIGHAEDQCPDHWRQYHLTVTSSEDLIHRKREVNPRVFCSNCAEEGHFAHACQQDRMDKYIFPGYPFITRYDVPHQGGKDQSKRARSTDTESEYTSKAKRFKSSHHHKDNSRQPNGNQALYPRGSRNSDHRRESGRHHQPSSSSSLTFTFRSQEESGEKGQSSSNTSRPSLSIYTKKFLQNVLPQESNEETSHQRRRFDRDKHFDWQGEDSSHHSTRKSQKRQRSHAWEKDISSFDSSPAPKRKKGSQRGDASWDRKSNTSRQDSRGWDKGRRQEGRRVTVRSGEDERRLTIQSSEEKRRVTVQSSDSPHTSRSPHQGRGGGRKQQQQQHKKQQGRLKSSVSQPGSSVQGKESLTVMCKNGFRTTVKTLNLHRNNRNAHR
ncbi:uncharacterized protein LOC143287037 [Babylonia areolata]|uniref:uncharacterized protein LOC143287037 n=1 Tax=Babylonia areolata TaxID=304850 RepID=UPI003FD384C4